MYMGWLSRWCSGPCPNRDMHGIWYLRRRRSRVDSMPRRWQERTNTEWKKHDNRRKETRQREEAEVVPTSRARCLPAGRLSQRYRPRHRRRMQQRPGWMGGPLTAGRPESACRPAFIVCQQGLPRVWLCGMGIYKFHLLTCTKANMLFSSYSPPLPLAFTMHILLYYICMPRNHVHSLITYKGRRCNVLIKGSPSNVWKMGDS